MTLVGKDGNWSPKEETVEVRLTSTGDNLCNFDFTATATFSDEVNI